MPDASTDPLIRALAGVLRDRLMQREDVEAPGLGTFCVRHVPSRLHTDERGRQSLLPPRDEVRFEPAAPSS